jgi:Site-specific recombinase XerD
MPKRSKFYLYRRKLKSGTYWYVSFIDPVTGKIMSGKSIDVIKERLGMGYTEAVKRRDQAAIIAGKALESGLVFSGEGNNFISYCREFWNWDTSTYVKMRNYIKANSLGREYCKNMLINFTNHVEPYIPRALKLQDVVTRHLDAVVKKLFAEKKLSTGTIQMVVISFSQPLKEAYRQGLITTNPADRLMKITRSEEARGVLSRAECEAFSRAARKLHDEGKLSRSYYLALVTAISTGMRSGEIRALSRENLVLNDLVRPDGEILDRIVIKSSIAPYSGIKCTKGKYEREICIPHSLGLMLAENADKAGRVFPSKSGGYISSPTLRTVFSKVLAEAGISEEEQKERNLTFHSLRHGFATMSRDGAISQEDRMLVLGHKSEKVNNRYTHVTDEQLERVSKITSQIVGMFNG